VEILFARIGVEDLQLPGANPQLVNESVKKKLD